MPSIGIFTEFNHDLKIDVGFRAGIVLGTGLHLHYSYTRYVNNSDYYFGSWSLDYISIEYVTYFPNGVEERT
jgi:hypothetical protein